MHAKYLGSVPVRESRGNDIVMDALHRIKVIGNRRGALSAFS